MKFPVKFLIGVLAVIIGISGAIVCLCVQNDEETAFMADYISAINDGDIEEMSNYDPNAFDRLDKNKNTDPIKKALKQSCFRVPGSAETVTLVELIGCSVEPQQAMGLEGALVNVLIKIEYIDEDGETQSKLYDKEVSLLKQNGQYIIIAA